MTHKVIIDCDPGADDAIALFLALASPELDVLGVTTVAGNVPLELTSHNALGLCALAGRSDMPVYAGCARPLLRPPVTAEHVHGDTWVGGLDLPPHDAALQSGHAVDFLIETLLGSEGDVSLAPTGPLTNIATAIVKCPAVVPKIREIVLMGGAIGRGNITPAAEFNIHADPHAASVVFDCGAPITMIGLDVTRQARATPQRIAALEAAGTATARAAAALLRHYGGGAGNPPLHDPCVIAYLLRPDLFQGRRAQVSVEVESPRLLGRTHVDIWGTTAREPNATVVTDIDADAFFALLTERLGRF